MSENCNNAKHPLLRDGTSQLRRLLKALLPSYVSVDERSMDDLIAFARRYAEEIFYYDPNNLKNGNWVDFFNQAIDENGSQTEPHYALFAAFLDLFRVAQDDLNTITARHLDFYYREVLQLKEKPAVPDQVFVVFELAKNTFTALLEKDTLLNAGKDATGKNLDYALDKNIVINKAAVQELKAVFADKTNDYRIYASPVANSSDGIGGAFDTADVRWRTFGRTLLPQDRPYGDVGFAIASPVLRLAEGDRTVILKLNFLHSLSDISSAAIANAFRVQFSGEKQWIDAEADAPNTTIISSNTLTITRTLSRAQAAVLDYNAEKLGNAFDSTWPVMKLLLNTESNSYAYAALKDRVLVSATIDVNVIGVKNLTLFSDSSKLKADKPFEPFTSRPVIGSSFYIGSTEAFQKKLTSFDIGIAWQALPTVANGFKSYYHNYLPAVDNIKRTNTGFKAKLSILDGKSWNQLSTVQLFDQTIETILAVESADFQDRNLSAFLMATTVSRLVDTRLISVASPALQNIGRDTEMKPAISLDGDTFKGFVKLELQEADFGHRDYPLSLTHQIVNQQNPSVVNPPYTPTIKEISLNYSSSASISFAQTTTEDFNDRIEQFLTIHPFGVREVHPFLFKQTEILRLLPQFNDEGNLYIGLSGLKPAQVVDILFKVSEGSANPDLEKQTVHWSYLSNNQWIEFPNLKLLFDGTNGLLNTGIVSFDVPSNATDNNTILTSGLHWLRVSVTDFSGAVCDLSAVHAQAMTATFRDNGNDPEHLRLPLAAETISKLRESNSQVKTISQPYASTGGKVKETSTDFYMRVSERLRHKDRSVTIWDYEHLVLEQFPSVYKVKCISHTEDKPSSYSEIAPGHVTLIVVSNLRNKNVLNPLQPKTSLSLLEEIKTFISARTSCWVDLDVRNPNFEEIRVNFNVRIRTGFDIGFYTNKLNDDIKRFLSPWAYDPGKDIAFGGKIYKSMILNFVEELEYVDYVTCFTMDHISGTEIFTNVDEAATRTAASILVSADVHFVHALETADCECTDNVQTALINPADDVSCDTPAVTNPVQGIGSETVGDDLIIGYVPPGTGVGFFQIETDFFVE